MALIIAALILGSSLWPQLMQNQIVEFGMDSGTWGVGDGEWVSHSALASVS